MSGLGETQKGTILAKEVAMKKIYLNFWLAFTSLLLILAAMFFMFSPDFDVDVQAQTTTITFDDNSYKVSGASVRLFENNGRSVEDGGTGIRFHVIMDADLYNMYKDTEGFKTYTVILPSAMLSGELSYTTKDAMVLETTDVWKTYAKDPSYVESVAYIYGLPVSQYATELTFRGLVSLDNGETIAYQTATGTRCMAYVAKAARDDQNAVLMDPVEESKRVEILNKYIPKYNVVYDVGGNRITETLEYGSVPTQAPQGISIWRDEKGNLIDLSKQLKLNNKSTGGVQDIVWTAYAKVTVAAQNATANVGGTSVGNGSTIEVKCGTHSLSASPSTNYYVSNISVNGTSQGAGSVSIMGDMTISVEGSIITYAVSLKNDGEATVTGTVNGTFDINTTCSFTLSKGFYTVTVNGTEIFPDANGVYAFTVTQASNVQIVKLSDPATVAKIMNIIASTPGTNLSVSGNTLVSPSNTGSITIPKAVFDELKKYGYSTITFDIYKPQKKELLYKKRIQNITNGTTIAECKVNQDSISASGVSLSSAATLEGQYKSFGSWNGESVGVSWTLSNIKLS